MKRLLALAMLVSIFLSACAQATPTADPAQIQASAVAAANTMVALTQAAMPTETSVPPTPLPSPTALPSPTLLPLPTLSIGTLPPQQAQPTTPPQTGGGSSSSGSDPCSGPLVANPDGPQAAVHVSNTSHDPIVFSIWLSQKTSFGECGYRGFPLSAGGSASITMPVGCYGAGASVNGKKPHNAFGNGCSQIGGKLNVVVDDTDVIKFR